MRLGLPHCQQSTTHLVPAGNKLHISHSLLLYPVNIKAEAEYLYPIRFTAMCQQPTMQLIPAGNKLHILHSLLLDPVKIKLRPRKYPA